MGAILAAKQLSKSGIKAPGALGLAASGKLPTGGAFGLLSEAQRRKDKKPKSQSPTLSEVDQPKSGSLISSEGL